jgi:hypothetical protein
MYTLYNGLITHSYNYTRLLCPATQDKLLLISHPDQFSSKINQNLFNFTWAMSILVIVKTNKHIETRMKT